MPTSKPGQPGPYAVAAVNRALDLIEALRNIGPATLSELAEHAGCTRSAAFRMLHTLQERGYAQQDTSRGIWRLGVHWAGIGTASRRQGALATMAAPFLQRAAAATEENVYLLARAMLDARVDALHGAAQPIRRYAAPGDHLPLHAGPCRLLLAHAPPLVQQRRLALPLARVAPATRTDPAWIIADLARLRERAWVLNSEDLFEGASSIAVPVRDRSDVVCAVLCVITPSFRLRPQRVRLIAAALVEWGAALGEAIG